MNEEMPEELSPETDGNQAPAAPSEEARAVLMAALSADRERPASRGRRGAQRTTTRRVSGGPKKATTTGPKPAPRAVSSAPAPNHAEIITGLIGIPIMACQIIGRFAPAVALDGLALHVATPQIAAVGARLAATEERVAAALERAAAVGPYGEVIALGVTLAAQFACNHGKLPPNPQLGILSPDDLVTAATGGQPAAA